ncbi:NAD(P)H-binding protein [Tardiphaga sp. 866_E4_N2_1]|uniref:NAD(P)H-binding protein n=1 Tax=unclassified Tardiphaga TaxID=2631404 RepID=UPI003F232F2F
MRIGISGASGQVGHGALAALQDLGGHDIVAITREPGRVPVPMEARLGDYDRPETLANAYAGLDRLLIIPGADLRPGVRSAQVVAAVEAAVAAGVGHVFQLSATATREKAEPAMGAAYWAGERHLLTSAAKAWTILRMNYFAETFAEQAGMAAGTGHIPGFAENRVAFVSRDDVAAACAGALAGRGEVGATYNLTGPDRVTGAERAALLAEFTGHPIDYLVLTEAHLRDAMRAAGLPSFVIDAVASMQVAQAEGVYDIVTGDVERLAGHAPRSLSDVLAGLEF